MMNTPACWPVCGEVLLCNQKLQGAPWLPTVVTHTPTGCFLTTVSLPHLLLSILVPESLSQCLLLVESHLKGPLGLHVSGLPVSSIPTKHQAAVCVRGGDLRLGESAVEYLGFF